MRMFLTVMTLGILAGATGALAGETAPAAPKNSAGGEAVPTPPKKEEPPKPEKPRHPSLPPYDAEELKKPLLLFVGDSVTVGWKAKSYSYVNALYEATRGKLPFRVDKVCSGGQGLAGKYNGIKGGCQKILEGRSSLGKDLPAYLVVQDFESLSTPELLKEQEQAIRDIAGWAAKSPEVRMIMSTVATEPNGIWVKQFRPEDIKATNEATLKAAKELKIPVVRLDLAWERWAEFTKDKNPALDWRLTGGPGARYYDGVHPGKVGILFQALVFAREFGVPPEDFDENAPSLLELPKEMTAEVKKFVYSWTEPTVVPQPATGRESQPRDGSAGKADR
jgi:hypothetical protein